MNNTSRPLFVHMYPDPTDPIVPTGDMFEIVTFDEHGHIDDVAVNDVEGRDHPEVPLTQEQCDEVVARLGYVRLGPWSDDGTTSFAPVEPL